MAPQAFVRSNHERRFSYKRGGQSFTNLEFLRSATTVGTTAGYKPTAADYNLAPAKAPDDVVTNHVNNVVRSVSFRELVN
jgi:hypothetical protein